MKKLPLLLAVGVLVAVGGYALARHVTHPVTPENFDKHPFAFEVQVKDNGENKQIEIAVRQKTGHPAPVGSATGKAVINPRGKKEPAFPTVARVQLEGVQTYTFEVPKADVDRAHFTFTETPDDPLVPFPSPGDYWVFDLSDWVNSVRK
jgi:hypothetical protein